MEQNFEALAQSYKENLHSNDRELVIDEILNAYVKQVRERARNSTENKVSFFVGGGSNAGKTTYRNKFLKSKKDKDNFLVIDADHLKTLIPEYADLVKINSELSADIVHKESSAMAAQLFKKAVEERLMHLFDATLKNTDKYQKFFSLLKDAGFTINLIIVDVSIEEALRRNRARYEEALEQGDNPRLVPDNVVIESHKQIVRSFNVLKGYADVCAIINTEGNEDEVIAVFERVNTVVKTSIRNESKYNGFLGKNQI